MNDAACLFCRIVSRAIPAEIVAETDRLSAFKDIHPQAPTHLLVVPKEHIPSLADASESHASLMGELILFAARLARQYQLVQPGYRLVVNCGTGAGQSVWHLHVHVLGGRSLQWPPG